MKRTLKWTASLMLAFVMVISCLITADAISVQAAAKAPKKIVLNTKNTTTTVGEKVKLKVASVKPAKASKQVTWSTSNKKLATVSKKGVVKAKKAGTVTITAKSKVNKKVKAKCKIKIYKATKTMELVGSSSYSLIVGESVTLNAKVTSPAKGYEPIKWSSADSKIATVDSNGKVTAIAAGTTTVTAKSGKKSVKANIQVSSKPEIGDIGVVNTNYGQAQGVKGDTYKEITLFKGVPYAAPPVGDLRWAEPVDPAKWDGVRTFDTYASAAMQWPGDMDADPWKTDFYYGKLPEFSEDCLYVNIATPAIKGDENLPVYVWFHGGGLDHGYSYEVECDPEALAKKGVVVVEVGTRLGVFGYMALPQLDKASGYGASGNYGLMDSIKAVEWVKENIKAFGGNPNNITVGGQSGGTSKTAALFASDKAKGLVKNVIWQTGLQYGSSYRTLESVENTSIEWLKSCGLTGNETLEELRAMDASVFMGKQENYTKCPKAMVVDNEYITYANLKQAYEAGNFEGVNILVGQNLGEFTQDGIGGSKFETKEAFYEYFKKTFGDLYDEYDFENIEKVTDENALSRARELSSLGTLVNYTLFGEYYDKLNTNGNVYAYLFSHKTPGRNEDYWWAWHSSELWYTFGSLRDIPEQRDWKAWDYELADIVTSYWANFMRTGNPNGEGLAEWLPANSNQLAYMNLGEKDTLGTVKVSDLGKLGELEVAHNRRTSNFKLGVIDTKYGRAQGVTGSTYKEVTLFKGVPYAAPPVGDLRWAPPEDPEKWDGIRNFDTYASAAMQWPGDMDADPWKTDFYYGELPEFSEDCLYVNIATPAIKGDENLPVYVWFHGGGLDHGYSYEVECDPEALAKKGVVVVEVGTRLGVFGYMALPQLDKASGYNASGNYGLMDSIKAVEWVKENIKAFGGNPNNITVGGQSGGTSKTAALFASDKAKGLVKNVIWQTGLQYNSSYRTLESVENTSIEWLKSCGLTGNETLEELRAMDASVFMGKQENYTKCPKAMVVDNEYITYANLKDAYEAGNFEGVNILVGQNLGEFTQDGIGGSKFETKEAFYEYFKKTFGDLYDEYDFENIEKVTDENALSRARELSSIGTLVSYTLFGEYYDKLNTNGNVYAYLFTHKTPGRNEDYWWAWHSSELWYTFGSLRDIPEQRDWKEWDYELADIVTSYWANFMRTGNPNGEGLAEWLPANSSQQAYMDLGEKDTLGTVKVSDLGKLGELETAYQRKRMGFE